jgi:tetratricopeptide (TPR) repeat protein
MDLIFDIFKKLKNHEIRQIRNHLNASPFEFEKVGKLFELVTRYKDKDEEFFSEKLYGRSPDNTFRVTKSRLKRILEDVILDDKSITDYDSDRVNALLQAQKRLLQGEILLGRGAYKASKNLLLQVVGNGRKFSLHNENFWAQMLLHRSQSVNLSVKEFQKGTDDLLKLNEVNFLVNEAALHHYAVTNILTQTSLKDDELAEIEQKIIRIEKIAESTESPLSQYYFLLSKILFLQYTYNYSEALVYCKRQLELINNEPAVRSKQRLGSAFFQLTEISLRKNDLLEAQKFVDETLAHFSKEETNYLIVLGTAFRIAFFSEDWLKANTLIQEALGHPRFDASPFRAAIWHYNKSCLLFKTGRISEALKCLNDATPLLGDKMGWNLTFRLHEIMVLFEAGLYDVLETKILNMRQFVKRTQKNSEIYRPMKLIQILMEWHKNSLDIKKTIVAAKRQFSDLQEFHQNIPFDPSTGELLRLENWLSEKGKPK